MAGFDIRLPNITADTQAGQLTQIRSYLYQLAEQLKFALESVETGSAGGVGGQPGKGSTTDTKGSNDAITTFNDLKALIIKSADIVDAYYETINKRLEGLYVAQSEFGTYTEQTSQTIEANSTGVTQLFENTQNISDTLVSVESTLNNVTAHIKSGLLGYDPATGAAVYGVEIGQRTGIDGTETFNKYARFTADKLVFYDSNDNEVAYISDKKLYISHVEITGSLSRGKFIETVMGTGDVVKKWMGGGA